MTPRIYKSFTTKLYKKEALEELIEKLKQSQQQGIKHTIPQEVVVYLDACRPKFGPHASFMTKFRSVRRDRFAQQYTYLCQLPSDEVVTVCVPKPIHIHCARIYKRNDSWYCAVVYSLKAPKIAVDYSKSVGVDLGFQPYVALSNGKTYQIPTCIKKSFKKLNRLTKAKCTQSIKDEIRLLRAKIKRQFATFHNSVIHEIFEEFDIVCIEKPLPLDASSRKHALALRWIDFVRRATQYALQHGKLVCIVQPTGNSDKCAFCNGRLQAIPNTRKVICQKCQVIVDRDVNAAKNCVNKLNQLNTR